MSRRRLRFTPGVPVPIRLLPRLGRRPGSDPEIQQNGHGFSSQLRRPATCGCTGRREMFNTWAVMEANK